MGIRPGSQEGLDSCPEALGSHGGFETGSIIVRSPCEQVPSDCRVENGLGKVESLVMGLWDPGGSWGSQRKSKSEVLSKTGFRLKGSHCLPAWPAWRTGWLISGKKVFIIAQTSSHDGTHLGSCTSPGHVG